MFNILLMYILADGCCFYNYTAIYRPVLISQENIQTIRERKQGGILEKVKVIWNQNV